MNVKGLMNSVKNVKLTETQKQAGKRAAFTDRPTMVGDVYLFADNCAKVNRVINTNNIPSVIGMLTTADSTDTFDENKDGAFFSLSSFGNANYNRTTGEEVSPVTIFNRLKEEAAEANEDFPYTEDKLVYNVLKTNGVADLDAIPQHLKGKKIKLLGFESVTRLRADGTPRIGTDGLPQTTDILCAIFL